jgi:hypothetical protein
MKTFRNKFGIEINICCASCQFKEFHKKTGKRICLVTEQPVDSKDICEDWHLSQGLENAGVGGGTVKSYEHLKEVFVSRTSTTEES